MISYENLPFNFRYIESLGMPLLTNMNGNFCFLDNMHQLESLSLGNIESLNISTINKLLTNNIIAERDELDSKINIMTSNYASSINSTLYGPLLVLIIPTLRCDHDCGYCQVSRVSSDALGYDAQSNDIDSILRHLKRINVPSLKIEFQGGEPLLNKEYIKEFYYRAIEELGSETCFVICSALGPLDSDFLEWSKNKNISYSTSLDGGEDVHQANRASKSFNSYKNTVEGIKSIQKELGHDKVNALATVSSKALKEPHELIDEYIQIGFESIFLRPLSPLGFAYKNKGIKYTPEMYIDFYKQCMEYIFAINKTTSFREETAVIYCKKILFPSSSGYVDLQSPSGLLLNALVINYDGNIFGSDEARMLWEMTKNNELISGNVNSAFLNPVNDTNVNLLSDTFLACTPGCDDCAYQPYCGADPLYHLVTQGDHIGNKAISDYCKLQRYLFDYFFELLNNQERKKVILEWLR